MLRMHYAIAWGLGQAFGSKCSISSSTAVGKFPSRPAKTTGCFIWRITGFRKRGYSRFLMRPRRSSILMSRKSWSSDGTKTNAATNLWAKNWSTKPPCLRGVLRWDLCRMSASRVINASPSRVHSSCVFVCCSLALTNIARQSLVLLTILTRRKYSKYGGMSTQAARKLTSLSGDQTSGLRRTSFQSKMLSEGKHEILLKRQPELLSRNATDNVES